jgi:hypothetical protein
VQEYLTSLGWPEPIRVDSGNGYHLLYRGDRCNPSSAAWVYILKLLAKTFNTEGAKVDTSVGNASRISRLPGTWNRKGPNAPDRPHRLAHVLTYPAKWVPVEHGPMVHRLAASGGFTLAADRPASDRPGIVTDDITIRAFIDEYPGQLHLASEPQDRGDMMVYPLLECPFVARAHRGAVGKSSIVLRSDGKPGYSCFSDDCSDHTFRKLLSLLRDKTGRWSKAFPRREVELTDANYMAMGMDPLCLLADREESLKQASEFQYDQQTWVALNSPELGELSLGTDPAEWGLTFADLREPFYDFAINELRGAEDAEECKRLESEFCSIIDRCDIKTMGESLGKDNLFLISRDLQRADHVGGDAMPGKEYKVRRLAGNRILSVLELKKNCGSVNKKSGMPRVLTHRGHARRPPNGRLTRPTGRPSGYELYVFRLLRVGCSCGRSYGAASNTHYISKG